MRLYCNFRDARLKIFEFLQSYKKIEAFMRDILDMVPAFSDRTLSTSKDREAQDCFGYWYFMWLVDVAASQTRGGNIRPILLQPWVLHRSSTVSTV